MKHLLKYLSYLTISYLIQSLLFWNFNFMLWDFGNGTIRESVSLRIYLVFLISGGYLLALVVEKVLNKLNL